MEIPRPARALNLSAKLKDTTNTETPQLSFQCKAVQDFHSRQADKNNPPPSSTVHADPNTRSPASTVPIPQILSVADSDSDDEGGISYATVTTSQAKRRRAVAVDDVDATDAEGDIRDKGMVF